MSGAVRYAHLRHLSTGSGLYEHARLTAPREEHGMCVDDVARALVVTVRSPDRGLADLSRIYLAFLLAAVVPDGRLHNRRTPDGRWEDVPSTDDHWGRALWAFGVAAQDEDPALAGPARAGAATALRARSPHPRATAYAALGAAQLLRALPGDPGALVLLQDAADGMRRVRGEARDRTRWPEARLTYANAVLPEAMVAVGDALGDPALRADGLALLGWLEDEQTVDGRLSVVAVGGRLPGDRRSAFDQQPIEVAALAEAAWTAWGATGDERWARLVGRCQAWFEGHNDAGLVMVDAVSGGGYDGLMMDAVNLNQGAESTLAWLSTSQLHASLPLPASA